MLLLNQIQKCQPFLVSAIVYKVVNNDHFFLLPFFDAGFLLFDFPLLLLSPEPPGKTNLTFPTVKIPTISFVLKLLINSLSCGQSKSTSLEELSIFLFTK